MTRILLGLRSRWTTPAEWTYLSPRYRDWSVMPFRIKLPAYQDLIEEILNKLFLQGPRGQETVEVGAQKFGDKVAVVKLAPVVVRLGARVRLTCHPVVR